MPVGLGLAFASIVSFSPPSGPQLEWDAPLECPDQSWVEERVGAYLGYPLSDAADVHVVAHAQAQAAGFVLDLTTDAGGVREQRRLQHHECAALVELAASLAAISIDPLAQGQARPSEPPPALEVQRPRARAAIGKSAPVATHVETPAKAPPPPLAPQPDPPSSQPLLGELYASPEHGDRDLDLDEPEPEFSGDPPTQVSLGASAGVALEFFPNPAPEVQANLGLTRGGPRFAFRGDVLGGAILAGRFRSAEGLAGGDLLAWDLGVRPCAVPRWNFVELRVCAALGGGQIRARGVNVEPALRRAHPWLWVTPELGVAVAVSRRVALVVDLGANFNIYRPHFSISNPDAEFVTPVASARGRFGVELRFL